MKSWIALLRGVNVGGKNILPMQDLRDILSACGFQDVATYIQSGNCVFTASGPPAAIAKTIKTAIAAKFQFEPDVQVLSVGELERAIDDNPFDVSDADEKSVHLSFLAAPAKAADLTAIQKLATNTEKFRLSDRVFYLYAPDGIGRSKLAAQLERKLGVAATGRNLRTARELLELAR